MHRLLCTCMFMYMRPIIPEITTDNSPKVVNGRQDLAIVFPKTYASAMRSHYTCTLLTSWNNARTIDEDPDQDETLRKKKPIRDRPQNHKKDLILRTVHLHRKRRNFCWGLIFLYKQHPWKVTPSKILTHEIWWPWKFLHLRYSWISYMYM